MRSSLDLSVVLPVHNEESSLGETYRELRDTVRRLGGSHELIFVDDGSDDESPRILAEIHAADPHVRVVRLRRNYGQTAALDAGFRLARGRVVVSMDADGENDPSDIPQLVARLEDGVDIVCGWRHGRLDSLFSRRLPSLLANWILSRLTGARVHDSGCSLRAYRRETVRAMSLYSEMHRLLPAVAHLHGARLAEVPVAHRKRRGGRSHYGFSRAWKVIIDLFVLRVLRRLSNRPTRWFLMVALPFLGLGLAALAVTARQALVRQSVPTTELPVVAASCAALLLFLSGYLVLLGVLGEALLEGVQPGESRDRVERIARGAAAGVSG